MKAVQLDAWGSAPDVLTVTDTIEPAAPAAGEVTVGVTYSPVNLHDLGLIGGQLIQPPLPLTPGNEGIGTVLQTGPGVDNVSVGDTVVLPLLAGAWRERLTVSAESMFPLPDGDPLQLSMIGSNTPTAGLMLSEYVDLQPGDWVIQDAANGGVGRNVIGIAKLRGLRTINFVRNPDDVAELEAAGADIVLVHNEHSATTIRALVGADEIRLAIDSVGGPVADTMIDLLSPGGTLVFYGNASGIPITTDSDAVTSKKVAIEGIFVGSFDRASKIMPVIRAAAPLIASGEIKVPIDAVYPLDDVIEASTQVANGQKVLLAVNPTV